MSYFSIHNHTDMSNIRLLDSTNKYDQLIDRALKLNLAGVAITDHDTVGNHLRAINYMKKLRKSAETEEEKDKLNKFKLVLGNEIYLVRNGLNKNTYEKKKDKYWHFILLAKDKIGHDQIRKMSSLAWKRSYRQFIERVPTYYSDIEEVIGENKGHLVGSTACLGSFFAHCILHKDEDPSLEHELDKFVAWGQEWFGEDFYVEIQPSNQADQITYNMKTMEYAKENNLKVVVTTDTHYLSKEDRKIHKAFLNANDGEREVDAFYSATYMMNWEEIFEFIPYLGEGKLEEIRQNTLSIVDKCEEYSLENKQTVPKTPIPETYSHGRIPPGSKYPYISQFFNSQYEEDNYFISILTKKLDEICEDEKWDLANYEKHINRLEIELEEIWMVSERLGDRLSAYFTTMAKIIDIAWEDSESIVGPGRGSAYVMLTCYLLGITQGDPLLSPVELPHWRFLHREKLELPDIDTDFQSTKKDRIIQDITNYFEKIGGSVVRIATFGTETSKAAIQTASRGLGYEPEVGTYLSSIVPVDRGQVRSLQDSFYGNREKEWNPVPLFVQEMKKYADIWEVAQNIEGLISRRGVHAAGVLITNDDFTNKNAYMKAPNGALTSQFELKDSEAMGGLKYDLLVTDALDKIAVSLYLLKIYGYIEWKDTLRKTYMHYLSPQNLDYENEEMWEAASNNRILNLFQFDTQVGSQAIRSIKPRSLLELGQANSLMRLMPEGRSETPVEEFIKYKNNYQLFLDEIESLNGTKEQKEALVEYLGPLKGVADSQESLMMLVMDKRLTNFTVPEANFLRKTISKKLTRDVDKLKDFLYQKGKQNNCSFDIVNYIWNVQAARQMGYSFSLPHVMAYSVIAVQEMNIAHFFPDVFWNTACLIVDSAGVDEEDMMDDDDEIALTVEEEEDLNDINEGILEKPKAKVRTVNYGKISSAIGKMIDAGIRVDLPDINRSDYTFTPDTEHNRIIFGMKGISKINTNLAKDIISNRPYASLEDFISKVKINKVPTINLIKAGCFDAIEGRSREMIMNDYIESIADKKSKLTLANIPMLEAHGLIPKEYEWCRRLFNYNKYLKKNKYKDYYEIDKLALTFFEEFFDIDLMILIENKKYVDQKAWDKIYKVKMNPLRDFLKVSTETLKNLNDALYNEMYEKYALGSISKWEMDSVNFYYHEHEMIGVNNYKYGIRNFWEEPEDAVVDYTFQTKDGKTIMMYKLWRIAGTVINKNKLKNTVTLLTTHGVVDIKIYKSQFAKYDKQLSEKQSDGKRKVVERSWFTRGNMIMVTGIRRETNFVPKVYKNSEYMYPIQLVETIEEDGSLIFKSMRVET